MKITQDYRVVTPAYGRDYTAATKAQADFLAGKDFKIQPENVYCSIEDFESGVVVNIRFNKLTDVSPIKVP